MTEMEVQGSSESFESSQPVSSQAPASAPLAESPRAKEERTFRQNEVSDIVKRAKLDAVESYKRLHAEQPQYAQQKYGESPTNPGYQGVDENRVRSLAAEEAQRHIESVRKEALQQSQTEAANRTVQNFWNKISTGKEKYQDFESVIGDLEYAKFPNAVGLLGDYIENADEVLYELAKDRLKLDGIERLAERSPRDAIVQMKRLAESIKTNNAASRQRLPNEPLSQIRHANQGVSGGPMTVKDFRAKYKG